MASLTKGQIVDAALAVVDRSGVAGLTMRSVAGELRVTAAALYYHIANRDELLDAVVVEATARLVEGLKRDGDWRAQLRELFDHMAGELSAHRDLGVWIITTRARQGPVMQLHERVLGILVDAGFASTETDLIKGSLFRLVMGHLMLDTNAEWPDRGEIPRRFRRLRKAVAGPQVNRRVILRTAIDDILHAHEPGSSTQ